MDFIHAAGITQCILLALYFIHRRNEPGNLSESLLLLVVAASISIGYLYGSGLILLWPHIARMGFSFMALIGPLFLFSVRAREGQGLNPWDALWMVVPAGITIYLLPFHFSSVEEKLNYLREDLIQIHLDCIVILYVTLLSNLISMGWSILFIYRKDREDSSLTLGARLYYLVPLIFLLVAAIVSATDPNLLNSGLFSGVGSLIVLGRAYVLLYNREKQGQNHALYPPGQRYRKSLLSEDMVQQMGERISEYMEDESPYLEPDFQLPALAKTMELSPVQTSQIINRFFECSFLQLIQRKRIEHAKSLLNTRDSSFSILDIAMESGFNSKSAFNSAFRKIVGISPSDYRKNPPVNSSSH
ncbi:MAG TPA: hypothetical protein DEA96_07480 [Leptospiraceae bacterium]|nr:hypothetical protein [Spirochaetaceae bacterium]HBS04787.1 hypothetical protein [Leptospiraceae bacterium]|tara:strand:+ start:64831 stop:65904 length:1074 start_codon:yes stop_codon:yes gene_type:complete